MTGKCKALQVAQKTYFDFRLLVGKKLLGNECFRWLTAKTDLESQRPLNKNVEF